MDEIRELERKSRVRNTAWTIVIFGLLIIWGIIVLFPFYWMLLTSVKSYAAYNAEYIPQFFTLTPTLETYDHLYSSDYCSDDDRRGPFRFCLFQIGIQRKGSGLHFVSFADDDPE